ncbi:hypothetical protein BpHYR1_040635 [Brachionus plicatilis]|uniref:Uncharacterized protein n=1 Tax=Brachionus plicatilis TaxID=10195 RepID=A0A3M7RZ60_BRAPC|nr:hypothetical protein BpHYR1_040635 [Brachionus plicatilis]
MFRIVQFNLEVQYDWNQSDFKLKKTERKTKMIRKAKILHLLDPNNKKIEKCLKCLIDVIADQNNYLKGFGAMFMEFCKSKQINSQKIIPYYLLFYLYDSLKFQRKSGTSQFCDSLALDKIFIRHDHGEIFKYFFKINFHHDFFFTFLYFFTFLIIKNSGSYCANILAGSSLLSKCVTKPS